MRRNESTEGGVIESTGGVLPPPSMSQPVLLSMRTALLLLIALAGLTACTNPAATRVLSQPEAAVEPAVVFSLFSGSGSALSDAEVARLLASAVEIPPDARIAVLQIPGAVRAQGFGIYGGLSEAELGMQRAFLDTVRAALEPAGVREVEFVPELLIPREPSIAVLREVAVRLQADALLVLRVNGSVFEHYRAFRSDEFKAYATCEAVLLDVRTGALPFTTVVTREVLARKQPGDLNDADTRRRAEREAVVLALGEMGRETAAFLRAR